MNDAARAASLTQEKVDQIGPILHGLGPEVQSAILADLVASWLAGHLVFHPSTSEVHREQTESARGLLLAGWLELVHDLVPVNQERILRKVRKDA
jgi:hypothetical protein